MEPLADRVPARFLLTSVDSAVAAAVGTAAGAPAGVSHLNCQFREPLALTPGHWPADVLQVRLARPVQILCTHFLSRMLCESCILP